MMKKIGAVFLISVLLILCASGCVSYDDTSANGSAAIKITDDTGYTTTITDEVHRVVSLAPSETEIFYAINQPDSGVELVGRTDYCNYPDKALSVPSMGGPQTLSIDAIVKAKPDLILATTVCSREVIEQLRELGYPVLVFKPENLDDIYRNIELVGEAVGQKDSADAYVTSMKERVSAIENMPASSENTTVAFLVSADPIYVAGSDTLQGELIEIAHGINVFDDKEGYYTVSDEALVSRKPDVIIVPKSHGTGSLDMKNDIMSNSVYREIPAVMTGRIYELDDDVVDRPGPRIIDALEMFYECINSA